ncbi:MAG: IS110 family transposase [Lachnospiraceae bacterium]|nr:IS110 family transposase [Lachnospiraceae bacterium]
MRKTKTDKVDTYIICKALMIQLHRFITLYDIDLMQLKNLGRFRLKTVKQRTRLKIQPTSYIDQVFPEQMPFISLLKASAGGLVRVRQFWDQL